MQRTRAIEIAILLALTACGGGGGGGGDLPTGDPGGGGDPPFNPNAPHNLVYEAPIVSYLVEVPITSNQALWEGTVTGFTVEPALPPGLVLDPLTGRITGTPTELSPPTVYTVLATGPDGSDETELDLSISETPSYAYTAHAGGSVMVYRTNSFDGTLEHHALEYAPAGEVGGHQAVLHPSGRYLWVPGEGPMGSPADISFYHVDPDNGLLEPGPPVSFLDGQHHMALNRAGTLAFVCARDSHLIRSFAVDGPTGALTPLGQHQATGTYPEEIVVDPHSRYVWCTNYHSRNLYVYTISPQTGALQAQADGLSFFTRTPTDIALDNTGTYMYVTFAETSEIQRFTVDWQGGQHVWGPHTGTGASPSSIVLHPTGRFAYVTNLDSDNVSMFRVDVGTGDLVGLGTVPAGEKPASIVLDGSGTYAYVSNTGSGDVSAYRVDVRSGLLVPTQQLRTRALPSGLALGSSGSPKQSQARFLYALNEESQDISKFEVDPEDGTLAPISSATQVGVGPDSIALDPAGRFAFVGNETDHTISVIQMSVDTGDLSIVSSPKPTAGPPRGLAVDPSGQYLLVSVGGANQLVSYSIHPSSGLLTQTDAVSTGVAPGAVSIDPTGHFVHISCAQDVRTFLFERGVLSNGFSTSPAPSGPGPLRYGPEARRAYAALSDSNLLVPYEVEGSTGVLTVLAGGAAATDIEPSVVDVAPNGLHAYAALPGSAGQDGYVAHYSVDPQTGALTEVAQYPFGLSPSDLRIGPQGRHLYVANQDGDTVALFSITSSTGALTPLAQVNAGLSPRALIFHTIFE